MLENKTKYLLIGGAMALFILAIAWNLWPVPTSPTISGGGAPMPSVSPKHVLESTDYEPAGDAEAEGCLVPVSADKSYDRQKYSSLMKGDPELCIKQLLLIDTFIIERDLSWSVFTDGLMGSYNSVLFKNDDLTAEKKVARWRVFVSNVLKFAERLKIEQLMDRIEYAKTTDLIEEFKPVSTETQSKYNRTFQCRTPIKFMLANLKSMVRVADGLENSSDLTDWYLRIASVAVEKYGYEENEFGIQGDLLQVTWEEGEYERIINGIMKPKLGF